MRIATYQQALDYLEGFIGKVIFKVDPSSQYDPLERMRVLLSLLGNPQEKFKSVLVGGTSGKGSTAYLISHILTTAGYKTGVTISPHLQKINERLQINGRQISDLDFTKMVASMIRIIETMRKMKIGAPSYFEILIGMAFLHFVQEKIDIAVVEVGMGGEFDGTNTLSSLIAVLTNVGLDHTNVLGKSVSKIARTKAGIIKSDKKQAISNKKNELIVITGVRQPSVIKIVEDKCREVGAKLYRLHKDFNYKIKNESHEGSVFDLIFTHGREVKLNDLRLSLLGDYQIENASLAVQTVLQLRKFGFKVSDEDIKKALSTAFFPGRFEIIRCHPELVSGSKHDAKNEMLKQVQHDKATSVVLDGAHNPAKMKAFLKSLEKIFPKKRKIFVIGFKFDKDIKKMLKQILDLADKIIITQFKAKTDTNIHASADALHLKSLILNLKSNIKVTVEKDSKKALEKAIKMKPELIIVTGSLYLVGEIRNKIPPF